MINVFLAVGLLASFLFAGYVAMYPNRKDGEQIMPNRKDDQRGLIILSTDKARGVDVVPDSTTDEQLAEMRASGRLVARRSDPPQDFDG